MSVIAPNRAAIGTHWDRLKAHTFISAQIANEVTIIGVQRVFFGQIEIVAVFHIEFPATHHTKTWAAFVAEFPLNMIKRQRQ